VFIEKDILTFIFQTSFMITLKSQLIKTLKSLLTLKISTS